MAVVTPPETARGYAAPWTGRAFWVSARGVKVRGDVASTSTAPGVAPARGDAGRGGGRWREARRRQRRHGKLGGGQLPAGSRTGAVDCQQGGACVYDGPARAWQQEGWKTVHIILNVRASFGPSVAATPRPRHRFDIRLAPT